MLNNEEIKKAIQDKEIEIFVPSGIGEGSPTKDEQDFLSSSLKDNLYSDRLKLTMGPIVKILSNEPVISKYRFKTANDCHDLRKTDNKYVIKPGESIIILTNERIKLNGKYACLIIPRISLSDIGIVATTAYVDPFYNGIMRIHLSNVSDKSYELTYLEPIAQCFFFELSGSVADEFKEQFPMKSVFFGQTWYEILATDRTPFPTKKGSANIDKFSNLKYQFNIIWSFVKKHSIIFMLLTNMTLIICGFAVFRQNLAEYVTTINHIEDCLEPAAIEIIINPGMVYGEKEITVPYSKSDIISILCNNDDVQYKILSGNVENETKIIFSYTLPSELTDIYEVNFTYVIVRRIM